MTGSTVVGGLISRVTNYAIPAAGVLPMMLSTGSVASVDRSSPVACSSAVYRVELVRAVGTTLHAIDDVLRHFASGSHKRQWRDHYVIAPPEAVYGSSYEWTRVQPTVRKAPDLLDDDARGDGIWR